jgi:hypothetical protein
VSELLGLLQEFHRDKLEALLRHEEGARWVGQYDANNTYQYIINREETQLTWIAAAIADLGGAVPGAEPPAPRGRPGDRGAARRILDEDAREAQAFVDRWASRVDAMTNARHRGMLRVILGETLEQKRFFEQALAGERDLLGRRDPEAGVRVGEVLPERWRE